MLSRDDILKADDLDTIDVQVPEWGGTVRVRQMPGIQRAQVIADLLSEDEKRKIHAPFRAAMYSCVDEAGNRIFQDSDFPRLLDKNFEAINRVFEAILKLSSIGDEAIEELGKGSSETPNEGSTSGSP